MLSKLNILGVGITNTTIDEVLEYVLNFIKKDAKKGYIVTPNSEILVYAQKHPQFRKILNEAEIALADGIGVILAGKLLGLPLKEKISGTDFMEIICQESALNGVSIGLLGGKKGVAVKTAECLLSKYPGLKIVFAASEWPESERIKIQDSRFKNEKFKLINHESYFLNQPFDILFVAYGAPKQEEWISKNLVRLPVKMAMGVGGAFDILSGDIPRAPKTLRLLGLEWLYRLIREPWRWKRQLALIEYVILALREKLRHRV